MPSFLAGRFGWSDGVGPLWFLKERWTVGPSWRSSWARFYASQRGITLQAHTKKGGYPYAGMFIPWDLWSDFAYAQKEDVVMAWIKAVRRPDGPLGSGGAAADPLWVQEYPALHEYLTAGTGPDGAVRRTSTITFFTEHGSWKCFLNERDAGASLCASGDSVAGALSALEVMLEQEAVPWRFSDPPAAKNGRPRGRGA